MSDVSSAGENLVDAAIGSAIFWGVVIGLPRRKRALEVGMILSRYKLKA